MTSLQIYGIFLNMKLALCQLNPTVGDIEGNLSLLAQAAGRAAADGSDLLVSSELFLTGYPPRDLLEKPWFLRKSAQAWSQVAEISRRYPHLGLLVGGPLIKRGQALPFNAALLFHRGKVKAWQAKCLLPSYDVFDETRYFAPAEKSRPLTFKGRRLGVTICEDAWNLPQLWPQGRRYRYDPVADLAHQGVALIINLAASPFEANKEQLRLKLFGRQAKKYRLPMAMVNQVGGNDELIFDGRSFTVDRNGRPLAILSAFAEELRSVDLKQPGTLSFPKQDEAASIYQALVLGVRDYFAKCGFQKAVLGLSGGIDSALVAVIATEALGPKNVLGITMPSPYSSLGSFRDSQTLAKNLGIDFLQIPITEIYHQYLKTLGGLLSPERVDPAQENLQARIRGNILMAFSNKQGYLVLSTGNKSELAVGYCTLYGDLSGGLAVISDVPKTMVYKLAQYVNRQGEIIPKSILRKAPSAELRPHQRDQDTLPPYPVLDRILQLYIEERMEPAAIVRRGYRRETVNWVVGAIKASEYKRKQAPPGLKVTSRAFGSGRRMPVAAKY